MDLTLVEQKQMIAALRDPTRWPHAVESISVIETHISWVLLAGEYAYKFKKAIDLGFLDYATLARRRFCADEELRLNQRTAPQWYLDVVTISGTPENPMVGGLGSVIDVAVRMRRFPTHATLEEHLAEGLLTARMIDEAIAATVELHSRAQIADAQTPFGEPDAVLAPMVQNFVQLRSLVDETAQLDRAGQWVEQCFEQLRTVLINRKRTGHVRECHGDLHLGNLAVLNDRVVPFDAIEFNPALRFIDVISELAFLAMDLEARGQPSLARRAINLYFEQTGDYAGVSLLDFYRHYRAMVRTKVAAIRRSQSSPSEEAWSQLSRQIESYTRLAEGYTAPHAPALLITVGPSGCGKSVLAGALVEGLDHCVRLRSDVERKRLFGLAADARSGAGVKKGLYSPGATDRTYAHLTQLAALTLDAGYVTVVDATFLEHNRRKQFRAIAQARQIPFLIVAFDVPEQVLRARVTQRLTVGGDPSEADIAVLEHQLSTGEALTADESAATLTFGAEYNVSDAVTAVAKRLGIH